MLKCFSQCSLLVFPVLLSRSSVSKRSQIISLWPQTCTTFLNTVFLLSRTGQGCNQRGNRFDPIPTKGGRFCLPLQRFFCGYVPAGKANHLKFKKNFSHCKSRQIKATKNIFFSFFGHVTKILDTNVLSFQK